MASLLSWIGNTAQRVGNTINNDVLHPVEHFFTASPQPTQFTPVQHTPQIQPQYNPSPQGTANVIPGATSNPSIQPTTPQVRYQVASPQPVQPAQPPQANIIRDLTHNTLTNVIGQASRPLFDTGKGLVMDLYHTAATPVELARAGTGAITHNMPAEQSALQRAGSDVNSGLDILRAPAVMAYQLGESLNPTGGDVYNRSHTFTGAPAFIFGNNPIPSMQTQYKQDKAQHGSVYAGSNAAFTAVMDALGARGTAKGVDKAANVAADKVIPAVQQQLPKLAVNERGSIKLPSSSNDVPPTDPLTSLKQEALKYKSADEFIKAQNKVQDYAMSHRPTEGPPAYNLTAKVDGEQMVPSDMYTQWYGSRGSVADKQSIAALQEIKGKPEANVTIYRASPKSDLNPGDWVTLSKEYAQQHAEGNGIPVHAHTVKAKDLRWAADDVNEFGYYPDKTKQLTDLYNQAHAEASQLPQKGLILKETKPRNGKQDVIMAVKNPQTGKLEPQLRTIDAPSKVKPVSTKTGVNDPQLRDLQDVHKQLVAAETQDILNAHNSAIPEQSLVQTIRQRGGISSSAYEDLPRSVKNKAGMSADKMAQELGYPSEDALVQDLQKPTPAKLTKNQAKDMAIENLRTGKSQYSGDYSTLMQMLKQRQDELSLYPKGTYRQVKVLNNAPKMSNAELQSLANTPEGKMGTGNKIVPRGPKKALRNADAERTVQQQLVAGTSSDKILSDYQKATGTSLQQAVQDVNRVARESGAPINVGKNPQLGKVSVPTAGEGDFKQATLNAKFVQQHEQRVGQQALDAYKKLTPHDQVLLRDIEVKPVSDVAKSAKDPQAFVAAEKAIRNYYDLRHAYDRYLGINVGYRTNYLRQLFDKVENAAPQEKQLVSNGKNPSYTKHRSVDTLGTDVQQALEKDISGSSFNHGRLAYEKGLNEAFPGKIQNGELVSDASNGVYKQLDNPYGSKLFAPKDIAQQINSRTWQPNASKALDRYDAINHGLKYLKLSGGLFHALTEFGNFTGQQLASGKLLSDPAATGHLFKTFFSSKAMATELDRMSKQGVLDKAQLSGLTTSPKDITADTGVSVLQKGTSKVAKYTGIQQMHDATFKREIPYAKLKIFEQKTEGLNPNVPPDLAKMRETARAINNLFGGINREVNGIKPSSFQWIQRFLLATDFTEGKWHTLYDAMSHGGPAGRIAREAVLGKALLFGLLATAGNAAAGNDHGKTPAQIAKEAAGNLLDPSFQAGKYTVGFPKTHISEAVSAVKPYSQAKGAPWNASGVIHYAQSRLAALPSEAVQLGTNKNYYNQPLYGKNTKKNGGGPISPAQTAVNVGGTVLPIPFGQVTSTAQGKQNIAAAGANILGLNAKPTPVPAKKSPGSAKTQVANGAQQPTKGIYKVTAKDGSTKYATLQGSVYKSFNNLNDAKAAQAKNEFRYSKKTVTTINGQQYHKTASGNVVQGPPPIPKVPTTSNTTYDPKTKTWTQVTPATGRTVQINANGTETVVNPGIGHITNARTDYVNNIVTTAKKYGVDPYAALAVAAQEGLGGGVGDNGTSFGPFQLHESGALPAGKNQAWAESPAGIDYAMQQIAGVAKGLKGQQAIQAIVNGFEKPLDPTSETANALAVYNGTPIHLTSGTANSGTFNGTYVTTNGKTVKVSSKSSTASNKAGLSSLNTLLKSSIGKKVGSTTSVPKVTPPALKKTSLKTYQARAYTPKRARISKHKVV